MEIKLRRHFLVVSNFLLGSFILKVSIANELETCQVIDYSQRMITQLCWAERLCCSRERSKNPSSNNDSAE